MVNIQNSENTKKVNLSAINIETLERILVSRSNRLYEKLDYEEQDIILEIILQKIHYTKNDPELNTKVVHAILPIVNFKSIADLYSNEINKKILFLNFCENEMKKIINNREMKKRNK